MKVLKITRSSSKDFQGTSAEKSSLSLKSVQSQSEESKSVSEVSSDSETVSRKDIRELLIRDPSSEL
ncbi:hypothetical protein L6452_02369 [Arctium lappa]|uniref:Uncharacterized protein n=1 Tax=Arctium lappa TaxID=4217 RepID=A0ACB9FJ82_ARCLA|nr:hypothetical protein L6452_02369 [Arctium lappa]